MTGALPDPARLRRVLQATWPAAETVVVGPFALRRSPGGGRRVTAATVEPGAEGLAEALPRAVAQMAAWQQSPIFQVVPETPGLDALLETEGYVIRDATILYVAEVAALAAIEAPRHSVYAHWPPLAIQAEIWAEGGIGPDRMAVMERVPTPRLSMMAREKDWPVGTGFVAIHDEVAMVHAIEVRPEARRKGVGGRLMARAAQWAQTEGATHVALAVTEENVGARALYAALGMQPAARYHYRVIP